MLGSPTSKRRYMKDNCDGFTLVELLVVVVIVGVLIAIALPLYLNYRRGVNDATGQSDLKSAINILEQCNSTNAKYPTATFSLPPAAGGQNMAGDCGAPINLSTGTSLKYTVLVSGVSYFITSSNSNGAPKTFCYNSIIGGSIRTVTPAPNTTGSC